MKLYNGDCLEIMKTFESEIIDLTITSPPYNIGMDYDSYDDKQDWDKYYAWCRSWLKEVFRVLKEDGRFCLNHYISLGTSQFRTAPLMELNTIALEVGFKHHSVAVWTDITLAKRTAWGSWLSASAPYINSPFEGILILFKNKWKKNRRGVSTINREEFIKSCRGVWEIKTQVKGLTKANFNEDLPKRCINLLSFKEDLVLDPFMGSGTTGVACKNLNRDFIGIELSKEYFELAKKRIANTEKGLF